MRREAVRGVITLAVIGAMAAAILSSPVGAAFEPSKKKIKRIAKKVVNQVAPGLIAPVGDRVAFASTNTGQQPVSGAEGTALTTTITAPAPGFLMMQAGGDWFNTDTDSDFVCNLDVDGADVGGSHRRVVHDGATGANEDEDCSTEGVMPVNAGTHTVSYEWLEAEPDTQFASSVLIAQYVPFDGTGNRPTTFTRSRDSG